MAPIITPPQEFYEKADLKAAAFLILNLTLLLGSGIIAWHLHVWWAYGVAALLVGGYGQACFILLHEAMHQSLLTNRTGNDIVGLVLASLLGVRFYLGREAHILHHREIGTDADPSSFWYNLNDRRPGWSTVRFLLLPGRHPTSEAEKNRCFYMKAGRLERLLISPFGFHFHHIHHIYPQVCVFQAKKLHTWLETYDPDYRHRYVIREGYMRTALHYVLNRPISGAGRFYPLVTR